MRKKICGGIRVLYRPGGPWESGVASSLRLAGIRAGRHPSYATRRHRGLGLLGLANLETHQRQPRARDATIEERHRERGAAYRKEWGERPAVFRPPAGFHRGSAGDAVTSCDRVAAPLFLSMSARRMPALRSARSFRAVEALAAPLPTSRSRGVYHLPRGRSSSGGHVGTLAGHSWRPARRSFA